MVSNLALHRRAISDSFIHLGLRVDLVGLAHLPIKMGRYRSSTNLEDATMPWVTALESEIIVEHTSFHHSADGVRQRENGSGVAISKANVPQDGHSPTSKVTSFWAAKVYSWVFMDVVPSVKVPSVTVLRGVI